MRLVNATILDLDQPAVRHGDVRIENGVITSVEDANAMCFRGSGEEQADCFRMLLMPGLTVGHTHLYSSLAAGMPPPARAPGNFTEILDMVWWKLDRALDDESIACGALAGAAQAALCGATTIVDHHASPNAISGSLDLIRDALAEIGLRGVLCYEVTDRNGAVQAREGIAENERFLSRVVSSADGRHGYFSGMAGAHAAFTLGDKSLRAVGELASAFGTGVHIHCAEDPADEKLCRKLHGAGLVERLDRFGILRPGTMLAHCTHLTEGEIQRVQDAGCWIIHNPRSNMNNSVGYANVARMRPELTALGTDGIDNNMFAESKASYFKIRDAGTGLGMSDALGQLAGSSRMASQRLGVKLGRIGPGAAADLVLLDYEPATPLHTGNVAGHWFFGLDARHVHSVMVGGRWIVRNRQLVSETARARLAEAPRVAARLWERFRAL